MTDAYFDRFDICEAHYLAACYWHSGVGSALHSKFAQLSRMGYRPRRSLGLATLTDNGFAIYKSVLERHGLLGE